MKIHVENAFSILKTASVKWWAKDPFRESAVIAYYAIFALPGLLVVAVTLAGYFFGHERVIHEVANQISNALGADTADQIKEMIELAGRKGNSIWTTVIGIGTILIGATGVFAQFQKSLNLIWEVKPDESKSGWWQLIRIRLFSFGLVVSISFILIVTLVVSALLAAFGTWLSAHFSASFHVMLEALNFLISLTIVAGLFALMFKILPDAIIPWRDVVIGAFVTSILFEMGKFGLSLYFGKANPGIGYGAAGSMVLILIWVSYSTMIVFLGAEFTRAYSNIYTGRIKPSVVAKAVEIVEIEKE